MYRFLAHLIDFNQMCYCYRKLVNLSIFYVFLVMRGRKWEAVRGRERPIGLEIWVRESQIYLSQSGPHGLSRPLTFGLSRPLIPSASQNLSCDLSEPIRESDLWGRSASHARRGSDCIARCAWEADRPHRFESLIGLSRTPIGLYRAMLSSSGPPDWFHG